MGSVAMIRQGKACARILAPAEGACQGPHAVRVEECMQIFRQPGRVSGARPPPRRIGAVRAPGPRCPLNRRREPRRGVPSGRPANVIQQSENALRRPGRTVAEPASVAAWRGRRCRHTHRVLSGNVLSPALAPGTAALPPSQRDPGGDVTGGNAWGRAATGPIVTWELAPCRGHRALPVFHPKASCRSRFPARRSGPTSQTSERGPRQELRLAIASKSSRAGRRSEHLAHPGRVLDDAVPSGIHDW